MYVSENSANSSALGALSKQAWQQCQDSARSTYRAGINECGSRYNGTEHYTPCMDNVIGSYNSNLSMCGPKPISGGGFSDNSRAVGIQAPPAFVQRVNPTPVANPFQVQANRNALFGLGSDDTAANSTNPTPNPNNPLPTDPAVTPPATTTATDTTSDNTLLWVLAGVAGVGIVWAIA